MENFPQWRHSTHTTPCWTGPVAEGDALCEHKLLAVPLSPEDWPHMMHTKRCLGRAMVSAIENMRDDEWMSNFDFRIAAQDNQVLTLADEYLLTGLQTCTCDDK